MRQVRIPNTDIKTQYVKFYGGLDLAIALRTFFVDATHTRWTAGAGIVADSVPEAEADETEHKAGAMAAAFRLACAGGGK